jgi:hypothetical protein
MSKSRPLRSASGTGTAGYDETVRGERSITSDVALASTTCVNAPRRAQKTKIQLSLTVCDNLPEIIPVNSTEIEVLETYISGMFDDIFNYSDH